MAAPAEMMPAASPIPEASVELWPIYDSVRITSISGTSYEPAILYLGTPVVLISTENEDGTYTPRDFTDWREIPSEALERKEIREKLVEALGSLAQKYREVFVLRDVEHMSIEDTALALGISAGAVKTRLLRARLMLRDLLSPGLEGVWTGHSQIPKGTKPWS